MTCVLSLKYFLLWKTLNIPKRKRKQDHKTSIFLFTASTIINILPFLFYLCPPPLFFLHYKANYRHHIILSIKVSLNDKGPFFKDNRSTIILLYHPVAFPLLCSYIMSCFLRTVVIIFSLNI